MKIFQGEELPQPKSMLLVSSQNYVSKFFVQHLVYCVRQNAYYLRHFSLPRVLRCPAGIDRGC